jgi:hypothetical protein
MRLNRRDLTRSLGAGGLALVLPPFRRAACAAPEVLGWFEYAGADLKASMDRWHDHQRELDCIRARHLGLCHFNGQVYKSGGNDALRNVLSNARRLNWVDLFPQYGMARLG